MQQSGIKKLRVGCILLVIFFFCAFALLTHPTQAANTVSTTITVGNEPDSVAIAPNSSHAYVGHYVNGSMSVIDLSTSSITAEVPLGSHPGDVAVTPNGQYVYATNSGSNSVSVISTATNASPSPTIPEFPAQLLMITLVVFTITGLSAVIIAKKRVTHGSALLF